MSFCLLFARLLCLASQIFGILLAIINIDSHLDIFGEDLFERPVREASSGMGINKYGRSIHYIVEILRQR